MRGRRKRSDRRDRRWREERAGRRRLRRRDLSPLLLGLAAIARRLGRCGRGGFVRRLLPRGVFRVLTEQASELLLDVVALHGDEAFGLERVDLGRHVDSLVLHRCVVSLSLHTFLKVETCARPETEELLTLFSRVTALLAPRHVLPLVVLALPLPPLRPDAASTL